MKKGYSAIEIIMVMFLLLIFGITAFNLVLHGGNSYKKMTKEKNIDTELRVAVSYIITKLRDNDIAGAVNIRPDFDGEGNALVLTTAINDKEYETWVVWSEGKLIEIMTEKGMDLSIRYGYEIAYLDMFEISYGINNSEILIKAGKNSDGIMKIAEANKTLRAGDEF